jgi:hypothetical protein
MSDCRWVGFGSIGASFARPKSHRVAEHGAAVMLHERQTLALDELSEPDRAFAAEGK